LLFLGSPTLTITIRLTADVPIWKNTLDIFYRSGRYLISSTKQHSDCVLFLARRPAFSRKTGNIPARRSRLEFDLRPVSAAGVRQGDLRGGEFDVADTGMNGYESLHCG
jgi:hypothetical protein